VLDETAIAGIKRVVVVSSERKPAIEAYLSAAGPCWLQKLLPAWRSDRLRISILCNLPTYS
jgi:UTP-glucose-1-phosphate uridylyltransferase